MEKTMGSNGKITLPKDAEGREIPLNTTSLHDKDGRRRKVDLFMFYPDKDRWDVVFTDSYAHFSPHSLNLTPPDSWEKLEEDLEKCVEKSDSCMYYSPTGTCAACTKFDDDGCGCTAAVFNDIKRRIRKLRGEGE